MTSLIEAVTATKRFSHYAPKLIEFLNSLSENNKQKVAKHIENVLISRLQHCQTERISKVISDQEQSYL